VRVCGVILLLLCSFLLLCVVCSSLLFLLICIVCSLLLTFPRFASVSFAPLLFLLLCVVCSLLLFFRALLLCVVYSSLPLCSSCSFVSSAPCSLFSRALLLCVVCSLLLYFPRLTPYPSSFKILHLSQLWLQFYP